MLRTSSSCTSKNLCRSCSSLNSSRASGLIGPMSRNSRSRSRVRAGALMPSGNVGISAASATSGSTSKSRRRVSTVASKRILTSVCSTSERRDNSRPDSSSRSVADRARRISSRFVDSARTSSLWRRRFSCKSAKRDSMMCRWASTMAAKRSVAERIFSIFSR